MWVTMWEKEEFLFCSKIVTKMWIDYEKNSEFICFCKSRWKNSSHIVTHIVTQIVNEFYATGPLDEKFFMHYD